MFKMLGRVRDARKRKNISEEKVSPMESSAVVGVVIDIFVLPRKDPVVTGTWTSLRICQGWVTVEDI